MKNILFLTLCLSWTFAKANTPIILIESADHPINAVIGDQSYLETFGEFPGPDVDDKTRIQTHLSYVENLLRQRDDTHLTTSQCHQREKMLDLLHDYWVKGIFPQNDGSRQERCPIFIDQNNNICAVGYLIQTNGWKCFGRKHKSTIQIFFYFRNKSSWFKPLGIAIRSFARRMCDDSACLHHSRAEAKTGSDRIIFHGTPLQPG